MNNHHPILVRIVHTALIVFGLLLSGVSAAQEVVDASAVGSLEAEVGALKRNVEAIDSAEDRGRLLEQARVIHDKATALQGALTTPVARINQRIELLGTDAAASADAAVRQQHLELTRELAVHVALTRRAALVEAESQQTLETLSAQQARALGEALFERVASPLTPALWIDGFASLRQDLGRTRSEPTVAVGPSRPFPLVVLAFVLWAAVVWVLARPGQRLVDRLGARLSARLAGQEAGFSTSLFAVWSVVVDVLLVTLCAFLLLLVIYWAALPGLLPDLGGMIVIAVVIGFFVRATVVAILQPRLPAWRLWKVGDAAAMYGVRAGNALAVAIVLIVAVEASVKRLDLSALSQVFMHSALALLTVAQIAYVLHMLGRMRRADETPEPPKQQDPRGGWALWVGVGWLAVLVFALFGVFGYVSFANRFSQWAIWAAMVFLATYIAMAFVDGLCKLLATAKTSSTPNRALQQAAVVLSALCRLLLLLLACGAVLVPFGAGFTSILGLLTPLAEGFEIGGVRISAAAIFRALLAFVVVIALIRFIRSWITESYLPTTRLQADARDSIDKILRYLGIVLAVLWALTAFGVGMEKVAILASALSVGIGFGLQAITQNFVSGLILLVERPVKIGDWVKLNGVEGDIRRINVRSTEIRIGDHSTMIVPNSELITKAVQNMTKGNSLGRAQMLLSVPVEADLDAAIDIIATTIAADEDVLESPAPAVFLDRVEGEMAVLNCYMHVRSPRMAYGVRSRVTLAVLRALRRHGNPASLPPQEFAVAPTLPATSPED